MPLALHTSGQDYSPVTEVSRLKRGKKRKAIPNLNRRFISLSEALASGEEVVESNLEEEVVELEVESEVESEVSQRWKLRLKLRLKSPLLEQDG